MTSNMAPALLYGRYRMAPVDNLWFATTANIERLANDENFSLGHAHIVSDYLRIFPHRSQVLTRSSVRTLMREGGFSTGASRKGVRLHYELQTSGLVALLALVAKTLNKTCNALYHRVAHRRAVPLIVARRYASLLRDNGNLGKP